MDLIRQEQEFAHFFGVVSYKDVFDVTHQTKFRYLWIPEERGIVPGSAAEMATFREGGWERSGKREDNRET